MFLGLPIANSLSDFYNLKQRIHDGGYENEKNHDDIDKIMYSRVFEIVDNESVIRFS